MNDVDKEAVTASAGEVARVTKDNANNALGNEGKDFIFVPCEVVRSGVIAFASES